MSSKKNDISFAKDVSKWQVHCLEDIKAYLIDSRRKAKRSAKHKWTLEIKKVTDALRTAKRTRAAVAGFKLRV